MDLNAFHTSLLNRIRSEVAERTALGEGAFPSEELVFAEIVMEHLSEAQLSEEPEVCHWTGKIGNANLRISGYSYSEDAERLDLFVTDYRGTEEICQITDTEALAIAKLGVSFLINAAKGKLGKALAPTADIWSLVHQIETRWDDLDQARVFVITDGQTRSKQFRKQEIEGKPISVEAMDVERLFRHTTGKPRDEIAISFEQTMGAPLACVHVPDDAADYDYALAAIPGEIIRALYDRYGPRLLEANVRSFLGARGKVNKGIAETLAREPEHFMAYNNGLVIVTDEAELSRAPDGGVGISFLRGLQIVNGGQTTSSIYFTKRKYRDLDLSHVRVPAKIIILRSSDNDAREKLVSDISRYANSQNAVKVSDLSANRAFHVQVEKLSSEIWCPDGVGRWFYERAAGSYETMLAREGTTPARLRKLKEVLPTSRKISKNDLAKYHESWRLLPHQVSLGAEKNFTAFMAALDEDPGIVPSPLDEMWYRRMIARAILFRSIEKLIKAKERKDTFRQGFANIAAYTMAVMSDRIGDRMDLDRIWQRQGISEGLKAGILEWAGIVNRVFENRARGGQFSEAAKRPEMWSAVRSAQFPEITGAPEVQSPACVR